MLAMMKLTILFFILTYFAHAEEEVDFYQLTMEAFAVCNVDGVAGLSWQEVSSCEDHFCHLMTVDCPSKEDFDYFDSNQDGILTIEEYSNLY